MERCIKRNVTRLQVYNTPVFQRPVCFEKNIWTERLTNVFKAITSLGTNLGASLKLNIAKAIKPKQATKATKSPTSWRKHTRYKKHTPSTTTNTPSQTLAFLLTGDNINPAYLPIWLGILDTSTDPSRSRTQPPPRFEVPRVSNGPSSLTSPLLPFALSRPHGGTTVPQFSTGMCFNLRKCIQICPRGVVKYDYND